MRCSKRFDQEVVIVFVEDEAMIAMMMEDEMTARGFKVQAFASAEAAIAYLRDGGVADVLFTDINLAGQMTGDTLAQHAREMRAGLAVAYTSGTQGGVGAAVPGSVFFAKPYSPAKVCDALARVAVLATA